MPSKGESSSFEKTKKICENYKFKPHFFQISQFNLESDSSQSKSDFYF
ncbi:hypothetical protein LEP1GSC096_2932 [Leptospira interrogans serovar Hebdomadis str. R499]|nr:hypothetical protein LEP1GSC096_2932 [Leptospira interrogans serovar Hebdomadis str. R499]